MFQISKKAIKDLDVADWENITHAVSLYIEDLYNTMPSKSPEYDIWYELRFKLDNILIEEQRDYLE